MNTCQKITSSANSFSTPPPKKKYTRSHSPLPGCLLEQTLTSNTTRQLLLPQPSLLTSPAWIKTPREIPCPWLGEAQHARLPPLNYGSPPLSDTSLNISRQLHPSQSALAGRQAALVQGNTAVFCSTAVCRRLGASSPGVWGRHDGQNTAALLRSLFPREKGGRHPLTQRKPCRSALGCQG